MHRPTVTTEFRTETGLIPGKSDACRLKVMGRITYREAPELRKAILGEVARACTPALIIDLGKVEYMDTAGVAVLVEGLLASQKQGLRMVLCEPSQSVLQVFRLAGLHDALENCCAKMEELQQKLT